MSQEEPTVPTSSLMLAPATRGFSLSRMLLLIRRLHLYFGLCLLPWALLYGITSFLFNHPTAFSDAPMSMFGRETTAGTALYALPDTGEMAARVVDELNRLQHPPVPYRLGDSKQVKFTREFAFATVAADAQLINVLIDVVNGGGTIRSNPKPVPEGTEKAPFALAGKTSRPSSRTSANSSSLSPARADAEPKSPAAVGIVLPDPLHERMKSAIPVILERSGFPTGEVKVTSVPELAFAMEAEGKAWTVTYDPMTGSVTGKQASSTTEPFALRKFLLRLHTAHGYPGSVGTRWFWAVVVDSMAAVLIFWGASGLLMWWQVKATRRAGGVLLLLSAAAATALVIGMLAAP